MNYTRLYPRFPAERFVSQSEFTEYCRAVQPALDTRYRHETSLTTRDDCVVQLGTCAPCLRRAAFTSDTAGWERLADGRRVPDWSDGLACDCADGLGSRARGLLHFAQSVAHLRSWSRLLLFGPASQADGRLAAEAGQTSRVLRLLPGGAPHEWRLPAEDGAFHIAVAADCLHRVPPLRAALAELRRVLSPGGSLVFSVPFRYRAPRTVSRANLPRADGRLPAEYREAVHELGWDTLDWLHAAGFAEAAVYSYWSSELGYLGPFNMILHAVA